MTTIDFNDLELPLAEFAAAASEPPPPEIRAPLPAHLCPDEPVIAEGCLLSMGVADEGVLHPVPGIRMKVVAMNRKSRSATLILDVEPGTRFPAHHHTGSEPCYVLSGPIYSLGRRLGPGDFLPADA